MSVSGSTFTANVATLALQNVTVEALGSQTTHLLYSDGDTMGAVAIIHLPSGVPLYIWPNGKTYSRYGSGNPTKNEREAVSTWYATLKK
jgi:hypothetical protein